MDGSITFLLSSNQYNAKFCVLIFDFWKKYKMSQVQDKTAGGSNVVEEDPMVIDEAPAPKANKRGRKAASKPAVVDGDAAASQTNEGGKGIFWILKHFKILNFYLEKPKYKGASKNRDELSMGTYLRRLNATKGLRMGEGVMDTLNHISALLLDQLVSDAREGTFRLTTKKRITTGMSQGISEQRFTESMCDEYEKFIKAGLKLWEDGNEASLEDAVWVSLLVWSINELVHV